MKKYDYCEMDSYTCINRNSEYCEECIYNYRLLLEDDEYEEASDYYNERE